MTDAEKELNALISILEKDYFDNDYEFNPLRIAKAIIERYPQIKAKEADRFIRVETGSQINKYNVYSEKKVNNIYLEVKE